MNNPHWSGWVCVVSNSQTYMGVAIHLPKPNIPEANFLKAMIFVGGSGASALLHNLYGVPTCPVCETWLSTCCSCNSKLKCNSCRHCWGCGENGSLL